VNLPDWPAAFEAYYVFYGPLYRCAYCGELGDTIDHTTPRHFVAGNWALVSRYRLVKVCACASCNGLAGGELDATWPQRKARIADKLARKARRLLMTAHWPDEELAELGYNLAVTIREAQDAATVVRRRLVFLRDLHWPLDVPTALQITLAVAQGQGVAPDGGY
jgi:hypothetical protein